MGSIISKIKTLLGSITSSTPATKVAATPAWVRSEAGKGTLINHIQLGGVAVTAVLAAGYVVWGADSVWALWLSRFLLFIVTPTILVCFPHRWMAMIPMLIVFLWVPVEYPHLLSSDGEQTRLLRMEDSFKQQKAEQLARYFTKDCVMTIERWNRADYAVNNRDIKAARANKDAARLKDLHRQKNIGKTGQVFRGLWPPKHGSKKPAPLKSPGGHVYVESGTLTNHYDEPITRAVQYDKVVYSDTTKELNDGQRAVSISHTRYRLPTLSERNIERFKRIFWLAPQNEWTDMKWEVVEFKRLFSRHSHWKIQKFRGGFSEEEANTLFDKIIDNPNFD